MNLFNDSENCVVSFSQTTQDWARTYLASIPSPVSGYYFVSAGIPSALKIKTRHGTVEYQALKQRQQYDFLYKMLCAHEFDTFNEGFIIWEQTKLGNVHFHAIVKSTSNKHDIMADFFCCFGLKKGQMLQHSFKVDEITDTTGLDDYLFDKKLKAYEKLCPITFKPLKIYLQPLIKEDKIIVEDPIGSDTKPKTKNILKKILNNNLTIEF